MYIADVAARVRPFAALRGPELRRALLVTELFFRQDMVVNLARHAMLR